MTTETSPVTRHEYRAWIERLPPAILEDKSTACQHVSRALTSVFLHSRRQEDNFTPEDWHFLTDFCRRRIFHVTTDKVPEAAIVSNCLETDKESWMWNFIHMTSVQAVLECVDDLFTINIANLTNSGRKTLEKWQLNYALLMVLKSHDIQVTHLHPTSLSERNIHKTVSKVHAIAGIILQSLFSEQTTEFRKGRVLGHAALLPERSLERKHPTDSPKPDAKHARKNGAITV